MTFRNPNTHEMAKSEVGISDKGNSWLVEKTEKRELCDRLIHKVRYLQKWQHD